MVDIFAMTLEVISRPFNIELLTLCNFVGFLQLLLDMFLLMQILLKTELCIIDFKKSLIEFFCHLKGELTNFLNFFYFFKSSILNAFL